MADLDTSDPQGIVDRRRGRGTSGAHTLAEINNTTSISAMKTRLQALKPTAYTSARLATMTKNDMLYALRQESTDNAGI